MLWQQNHSHVTLHPNIDIECLLPILYNFLLQQRVFGVEVALATTWGVDTCLCVDHMLL